MILVYNPAKNPMAKANIFRMANVTVAAGVNYLTDKQATALKSHPEFDKFVELGVFHEVDGDTETEVKTRKPRTKATPILLEMPEK